MGSLTLRCYERPAVLFYGAERDLTAIAKNDYERVTGNLGNCAYSGGMPANELNRDNHEFTHNEANYWIYTFTTRNILYCTTASGSRWMRDRLGRAKPEPISNAAQGAVGQSVDIFVAMCSPMSVKGIKRNDRPRHPSGRLSFGSPILKKEQ